MTKKKRYARRLEDKRIFKPLALPLEQLQVTNLTLDQIEAIRLVDYEGKSQIEAAKEMGVSRGTIQRILEQARYTLVDMLINNKALEITNTITDIRLKGENKLHVDELDIIKIAFPTKDKVTICSSFNDLEEFMVYTIKDSEIIAVSPLPIYVSIDYNIPIILSEYDVNVIITSSMEKSMIRQMDHAGIDVILGGHGRIDINLNEYMYSLLSSRDIICEP